MLLDFLVGAGAGLTALFVRFGDTVDAAITAITSG